VDPVLRQRLFHDLGIRFRAVGWWAIGTLVVTGVANLWFRGWLRWDGVLGSAAFWATATGRALAVKLIAVAAIITLAALHDFVFGPRVGRHPPGSPEGVRLRRRAALMGRANALIGLLIVIAAVILVRGG
jgi:hypothetical protein